MRLHAAGAAQPSLGGAAAEPLHLADESKSSFSRGERTLRFLPLYNFQLRDAQLQLAIE